MKLSDLFETPGTPFGGGVAADAAWPVGPQVGPNDKFVNKLLFLRKALAFAMRRPELNDEFMNAPTVEEASAIAQRVLRTLQAACGAQDADIKTVAGQYAYDYWPA